MDIKSVNNDNIKNVSDFLNGLNVINDLNEEVVANGEFILEEGEILGFLSYEVFNNIGLIRYFIFKNNVDIKMIDELFYNIKTKALKNDLDFLLSMVVKEEAIDVFTKLGFEMVEKKNCILDEVCITNTKFKEANILKYKLD